MYTVDSNDTTDMAPLDIAPQGNIYVRVCLYGETEEPSINLTPDSFESNRLEINQSFLYTFNIRNNSKYLPITYRYNKIPFIEMDPSEMLLSPNRSVDVLLIITPKMMGKFEKNINLGLFFTNKDGKTFNVGSAYFRVCFEAHMVMTKNDKNLISKFVNGITPNITNEVGYLVDDIRFNTKIEKPIMAVVNPNHPSFNQDNNAVIAFPNDRARSLRPNFNVEP